MQVGEAARERATRLYTIVHPDGTFDEAEATRPRLSQDDLLKLYRWIVLLRAFDTKAFAMQRQGRIGAFVPCRGQEAAQIGSVYALEPQDWAFPSYRDHGVCLVRGVSLRTAFCHLFANAEDFNRGRNMPNHWGWRAGNVAPVAAPVGTKLPVAVGVAMAARMRRENVVSMVYFGDGATSQGDFHVACNFAGVFKAPTVFLCQNNQYAISVPVERQTATESIAVKALAYGIEGVRVDGNDILAVYSVCKEAVDRARRGEGATLVEALTYRLGAHSSADDPKRYREDRELGLWEQRDPLKRYRLYLEAKGLWNEGKEEALQHEMEGELNAAISAAEQVQPPPVETLVTDVYGTMPWHLAEQLEESQLRARLSVASHH